MGNYVFLGAPGAGKGTMAGLAAERFGIRHISTGDILRAELKAGTELGRQAQQYMEAGELVPDALVAALVNSVLGRDHVRDRGFILDGYPRTVTQADLLHEELDRTHLNLDAVVLIEVSRDLLMQRLTARRVCPACRAVFNVLFGPPARAEVCDACGGPLVQRPDDNADTVAQRLAVYQEQTAPLIEYYESRCLLRRTPGDGGRETNFQALCRCLGLAP